MKKFFLSIFAAMLTYGAHAQVNVTDHDKDGKVTVNDAVMIVDDVVAGNLKEHSSQIFLVGKYEDPYTIDNSLIEGVWWSANSGSVTFNEDGTTNYSSGCTYECMPYSSSILLFDQEDGMPVQVIDIILAEANKLVLCARGTKDFKVYYKDKYNGHEFVDLGLSVKWATMNVGASAPEQAGTYYAWGETSGRGEEPSPYPSTYTEPLNSKYTDVPNKTYYGWDTYKYMTDGIASSHYVTKYQPDGTSRSPDMIWYDDDYNFIGDNKRVLEPEDDAAHVNWGGLWEMPTSDQCKELLYNCYLDWTTEYNGVPVKGYVVYKVKDDADKGKRSIYTGQKPELKGTYTLEDPHIFLPILGYAEGTIIQNPNSTSRYWAKNTHSGDVAYQMVVSTEFSVTVNRRCHGCHVRPVIK